MIQKINYNYTERIVHHLMLEAEFVSSPGLLEGQMGIILVFTEYYKKTKNEAVLSFIFSLLDNTIEKISKNFNYSFGFGLAGIGWGIEYLIQHSFVNGLSVEICEEIDQKIMETDFRRINDVSLDIGIEGLLHYVIYHLQGSINQGGKLPFDHIFLTDIYNRCKNIDLQISSNSLKKLIHIYNKFYCNGNIKEYDIRITDFLQNPPELSSLKLSSHSPGLRNGLSGTLLTLLR